MAKKKTVLVPYNESFVTSVAVSYVGRRPDVVVPCVKAGSVELYWLAGERRSDREGLFKHGDFGSELHRMLQKIRCGICVLNAQRTERGGRPSGLSLTIGESVRGRGELASYDNLLMRAALTGLFGRGPDEMYGSPDKKVAMFEHRLLSPEEKAQGADWAAAILRWLELFRLQRDPLLAPGSVARFFTREKVGESYCRLDPENPTVLEIRIAYR